MFKRSILLEVAPFFCEQVEFLLLVIVDEFTGDTGRVAIFLTSANKLLLKTEVKIHRLRDVTTLCWYIMVPKLSKIRYEEM